MFPATRAPDPDRRDQGPPSPSASAGRPSAAGRPSPDGLLVAQGRTAIMRRHALLRRALPRRGLLRPPPGVDAPVSRHDTEEEAEAAAASYARGVEDTAPASWCACATAGGARPLRAAEDKPLFARGWERFGDESRYRRFMGAKPRLSTRELSSSRRSTTSTTRRSAYSTRRAGEGLGGGPLPARSRAPAQGRGRRVRDRRDAGPRAGRAPAAPPHRARGEERRPVLHRRAADDEPQHAAAVRETGDGDRDVPQRPRDLHRGRAAAVGRPDAGDGAPQRGHRPPAAQHDGDLGPGRGRRLRLRAGEPAVRRGPAPGPAAAPGGADRRPRARARAARRGLPEGCLESAPVLNPLLALGRPAWSALRARVTELLRAGGREPGAARSSRWPRPRASCRSAWATTSTSTPRSSTHPTSGACSARTPSRCCPTGATCRSATTGAPAPWSSRARRCAARTASSRPPSRTARPRSGRRGGWTSSSSWASSPGPAARSARRSPPPRRASGSSASCSSTTGAPATYSAGSTNRSVRSWASRSPPRSRPGSSRWRRSSRSACPRRRRTPNRSPYLRSDGDWALDVDLEVALAPEGGEERVVSRTNARGLYWTAPQQLAHATANGAARGRATCSPPARSPARSPARYGSLIELTWGGRDHLPVGGGRAHLPRGRRHRGPARGGGAGPGLAR